MTNRTQLLEAVAQAARDMPHWQRPAPLNRTLRALAAQSRPPEAETVTLGLMRSRTRGDYMACAEPEQEDPCFWVHVANITFMPPVAPPIPTIAGTVTLPLNGEAV